MRIDGHVLWGGVLLAALVFGGPWVGTLNGQDVQLRGVTGGGLNLIQPGRWGLVKAWVENGGRTDRSLSVAFNFAAQPGYQFVRETWVPAGSRRRVVWPARLTEGHTFGEAAEGEVRVISTDEQTYDASQALLTPIRGGSATALIRTAGRGGPEAGVLAVRRHRGLAERLAYPLELAEAMPRYTLGWEPIDVLVLCEAAIEWDAGHRRALRRWLRAGGTVWVMVNEMAAGSGGELFDESWDIAEVDRVSFNAMTIRAAGSAEGGGGGSGGVLAEVSGESPIEMARVMPGGFEVLAECRGWPALLRRSVGRGRLVVTTVGWPTMAAERADAWRRRIADAVYPSTYEVGAGGGRPAMEATVTDPFIRRHIAYKVAGRWVVGGVLIGFAALMFVSTGWLVAVRRGELAAAVWLVLVVIACGALLGVGASARHGVGRIDAQLQVVHAEADTVAATVEGAVGMFSPETRSSAALSSAAGGWAWPRDSGDRLAGEPVRLQWTDLDHWRWRNLRVGGGTIRMLDYQSPVELDATPSLRARFSEAGLVGAFDWPTPQDPEDLVLVTERAAMGVRLGEAEGFGGAGRGFAAPADAVLPPGVFVDDGVLTDTQRHRSDVLEAMRGSGRWPGEPMLAGWTDRIDAGLRDEAEVAWRGGALWLMPLKLTPTSPGERVTVPWPFVSREQVNEAPGLTVLRTLYDSINEQWIPSRQAGAVVSRFVWPDAVGAVELEAATLFLDISAPGRTVRIFGFAGGKKIELASTRSPDGRWEAALPMARLGEGARRSLVLAVDVGALGGEAAGPRMGQWRINGIGLQISGRTSSGSASFDAAEGGADG